MTAIDAGADPRIAAFDRPDDAIKLVVERARPVIVDRNAYVVFGNERIETCKRLGVRLGIGSDRANAKNLGKFKNAPVRCMILRKSVDALSRNRQAGAGRKLADRRNLLVVRRSGQMGAG